MTILLDTSPIRPRPVKTVVRKPRGRRGRSKFTPEVIEEIRERLAIGETIKAIALTYATTPESIRSSFARYGVSLSSAPPNGQRWVVFIPSDAAAVLRVEASYRKTKPTVLVAQLLEAIAGDNLFEAVLDTNGEGNNT